MTGQNGEKIEVPPEWWDNAFSPSSCLALVTTIDAEGRVNAAPYGTVTRVCHDPVHIAFTAGMRRDTTLNVQDTGLFTVNLVPHRKEILRKVLVCGLPFKPRIDEFERAGLTALPGRTSPVPLVAECTAHFECKVAWTRNWLHRVMICGSVEAVSVNWDCLDSQGYVRWDKLQPSHYCGSRYGDMFVPIHRDAESVGWSYEGSDEDFVEGRNWRASFTPPRSAWD